MANDGPESSHSLRQAAEQFFPSKSDGDLFLVSAQECLERNNSSELFKILHEEKYKELLDYVGWELVKIIFQFLPEDCQENTNEFHRTLIFICNTCNPREICLSLSEILVRHLPWQKCIVLVRLLQTTCKRLVGKVAKIYSSILTSLTKYIRKNNYENLSEILEIILEFLRPRVEVARDCILGTASDDLAELISELRCFLVNLLEFPFAEIDISKSKMAKDSKKFLHDSTNSTNISENSGIDAAKASDELRKGSEDLARVSDSATSFSDNSKKLNNASENYVQGDADDLTKASENITTGPGTLAVTHEKFSELAKIVVEYIGYVEVKCLKSLLSYGVTEKGIKSVENCDEEPCSLSYVGLGCLGYLVFVEDVGSNFLPLVLTGRYSLDVTVTYINVMLCSDHIEVVRKGLQLLLAVMKLVEAETYGHSFTEQDELFKLTGFLVRVMTHHENSDIRKQAVQSLREFLNKFGARGKYKILRLLHQNCDHSGVAEFLILILKEEIVKCFQENNEWFTGAKLASFLKIIFNLPANVFESEHGIVEERNRILSTLNLFRYLLIRDNDNRTRIHTLTSEVEQCYFKPLTDTISLSKANLKTSVQEKMDHMAGKVAVPKDEVFNVSTPDGCEVEQGSLREQLEMMQSALLTIDMIESVLVRIREICEARKSDVIPKIH